MLTNKIIEIKEDENKIVIQTSKGRLVELSLKVDCDGIYPGNKINYCNIKLVIGFSNNKPRSSLPSKLICMLGKGGIGYLERYVIEKTNSAIIKAERPMTAETAEEEIKSFLLNS